MNKSFESQRHRGTLLHRTSMTLRVVVSLGFKKLNRISTVQVSDTTKLNGYSSAKYKYKTLQIKMAVIIITAIEKFLFNFISLKHPPLFYQYLQDLQQHAHHTHSGSSFSQQQYHQRHQ
jgi:hypothetical protein